MPSTSQEAQAHIGALNSRKRQKLPKELLKSFDPVYVHNTFDMAHVAALGSLRTWNIPPCPKGRDFVSLPIPGMLADEYDAGDGNGNMGVMPVMGDVVAREIVGCNSHLKELSFNTTNKEWWGVFWSKNQIPSKKELADAKEKLTRYAELMVADGNRRFLEGNSDKPGVGVNSIGPMHRRFAEFLGTAPPWAQRVTTMVDCPGCGDRVKPNIIRHTCGYVFDKEAYLANFDGK